MSDHKQELFSTVATHLLTQMKISMVAGTTFCAYREGALRCAVGCLIDDTHYNVEFEGRGLGDDLVMNALQGSLGYEISKDEEWLLYRLQGIHDGRKPEGWLGGLKAIAVEMGLSMPEVTA